jgi:hypothetical protein
MADAPFVVDCKHWRTHIDVKDVGSFIGLVDHVGAEVGMLMSTQGATAGAGERARAERRVRLEASSLEELRAWSPRGTVTTSYRIPADGQAVAERALRNAGFRVAPNSSRAAGWTGRSILTVRGHRGS